MSVEILNGDCTFVLGLLPDDSADSCVTDPPYHLTSVVERFGKPGSAPAQSKQSGVYARSSAGFMGQQWDGGDIAFRPETWAEVLRVLKPGGYLLAFGGTRTHHRLACAIEDAGFEIRDMIGWLYGCLDDETMAVTPKGVMPYHKISQGDLVLAYDSTHMSYQWEQVEEVCVYDVDDTVYRIATDFGDQVVSRNHRCIVERDGAETFEFAENAARQREVRVPVLEDLRELLGAISNAHKGAGQPEQDVFAGLHESIAVEKNEVLGKASGDARSKDAGRLRGMRGFVLAQHEAPGPGGDSNLLPTMQRDSAGAGLESVRAYGAGKLDTGVRVGLGGTHDRPNEPCMEGRRDIPEAEGELRLCAVRPVSTSVSAHVAQGRIHNGAPAEGGNGGWPAANAGGVRSSYRPQAAEQRTDESDAVCDEQGPQAVRAWRGHKAVMGRITPERYRGVIWCVRVKSGAFVAVRNGFAFPTGNSGFPKTHNQHGEWEGWGTALKPAWEPIVVARKALDGTVSQNLERWGVGALNIDGCRVGDFENTTPPGTDRYNQANYEQGYRPNAYQSGREGEASANRRYADKGSTNFAATPGQRGGSRKGRWPANLIHDGSDEVLACFPESKGQQRSVGPEHGPKPSVNTYGDFGPRETFAPRGDSGSAARFFYCAKASRSDRNDGLGEDFDEKPLNWSSGEQSPGTFQSAGTKKAAKNNHPTVKPTNLMRYLCRLVTPPGGTVLDPFMGSGSTGRGAVLEGFNFIGIEQSAEYVEIAKARIKAAQK